MTTLHRVEGDGESAMDDERVAPDSKGVSIELLSAVDLRPVIAGMAGRQLRMHTVTIEPGGIFGPIHDHLGRPGVVYILQGTIIGMARSRSTGLARAGPKTGTPRIDSRTQARPVGLAAGNHGGPQLWSRKRSGKRTHI